MNAAWVAGSVRARALARRRLGDQAAREVSLLPSLGEAVAALARSAYGWRVRVGDPLERAQRGIAETLLWHLRVLAGWLPPAGADLLRLLASGFELSNLDEHLRGIEGMPPREPYRLGTLATAWPALAQAGSRTELRAVLAVSAWGDPGGETDRELQLTPRVRWAQQVAQRVPCACPWASGAVALMVAREMAAGRPLPPAAAAGVNRLIGAGAAEARSLDDLRRRLCPDAAWVLQEVPGEDDLWRAEARWWARLRADGTQMLSRPGFGGAPVIGAVALLCGDAALARAALELAAYGADRAEVLDALA